MGTFANEDVLYTNNPSPSTGTGLLQMRQNQKAIKELVGASAPVTLEIVDGSITPTSAFVLVDTEGQAAADDLTVINVVVDATNTLHDGMLLYLQAADAGRVVTVKNSSSANGIRTAGGGDITLVTDAWLVLQLRSGTWYELAVQPSGVLPIANGGTGSSTKNFVDLTSAQTVAGQKTLTSNLIIKTASASILFQQTDIVKGTNPSANQAVVINMVDSAGTAAANRTGYLENRVTTAGLTSTSLYAYQFANGSTANAQLGVFCSADGTRKYATAPTPAAGDNSNKIATTEWVNANAPSMMYNTREELTASGSWTAPVTGWYKRVVVGGGGGGGAGGFQATYTSGSGGAKGGDTTFDDVVSLGGGGGAGGGATGGGSFSGGSGGGGGSGEVLVSYKFYTAGTQVSITIGAGGAGGNQSLSAAAGGDGGGTYGGKGGLYSGGRGGWCGSRYGQKGENGETIIYGGAARGSGGNGGATGLGYGGGGGGGGGGSNGNGASHLAYGLGQDGGENGKESGSESAVNKGGAGGAGVVILEYFDPLKAA